MTFLAYSAPHGCSCVARRDCGCELSPFPFVKDARPPSLYLRQLAPATCLATCGGGLLGGGDGDGGGVVTWWSGIALRRGVRTELVQICPRVVYQCSPTRIFINGHFFQLAVGGAVCTPTGSPAVTAMLVQRPVAQDSQVVVRPPHP